MIINYFIFLGISQLVFIYFVTNFDYNKAGINPVYFWGASFIPGVNMFIWAFILLVIGEKQNYIKDTRLNRWLGLIK